MRHARYLVVIAVAAALGGCGGGGDAPERNTAELERDLAREIQGTTGTRDVTVDCPDEAGEGDVCDVTAPGGVKAKVTVEGEIVQP